MQAPFNQPQDEDFFANPIYNKNIECIIPAAELLINFKANGIKTKKLCFIYAEKMDFKGLIQIRLAEKCDQRKMYITTVDSGSFPELKQDQSLHVTFSGFVDNLVNLLQDCQAGKLQIFVIQLMACRDERFSPSVSSCNGMSNQSEYQLQFLELRSFKNLTHLCLPCHLAPLSIVLFYMSSILEKVQNKITTHDQTAQKFHQELQALRIRNEQLETENIKLRENQQENNYNMNQRHAEELQKLQDTILKATEERHSDNERNRKTILKLQAHIEKFSMEKSAFQLEKNQENKRLDSLNDELSNSLSQISQLKMQKEQLQTEIASLKNEERKNEMHLNDARKHLNDLQDKLKKYDKSKADIVAELEAEKKICQTKRQALEVATEEITKANEIIYKQSQELLKLKNTVEWRTEIALQQEKAIQEKERELSLNEEEINQMRIIVNTLRQEVPEQLESLRQFANTLEEKYREEIRALQNSLKLCKSDNKQYHKKPTSSRHKWQD